MIVKLPTFKEAEAAVLAGHPSPIEIYIYEEEPVLADEWRRMFVDALNGKRIGTIYEA